MSQRQRMGNKRLWTLGAVVILMIILLTRIPAPGSDSQLSGSSYNRAPDGYGAWYAYMGDRGTPLTRWQKPFEDLADAQGVTLVRVDEQFFRGFLSEEQETWLKRGNRLVQVGYRGQVTDAEFRTQISSAWGTVTLETRRRYVHNLQQSTTPLLQDNHGIIAWATQHGQGEVISIIPPDVAANAYQDSLGNYEFLAQLVAREGDRLLIDEYIHGYKDTDIIIEEVAGNWADYLAQTPLMLILIQSGLILLIIIWASNRRSRPPVTLASPKTNNSLAYIEALAGVLQKAKNRDFVVTVIGREEQRQIQQNLGLGSDLIEPNQLLQAWQQQTGKPASELITVLRPYWDVQKLSQSDLISWIQAIQRVHDTLNQGRS